MRIIRESTLQKMLTKAYILGLNIREEVDRQTKRLNTRGTIMPGYDMDKDLEEILKRKGGN